MIIKALAILLLTATASLADNVRHLGNSLNEYTQPSVVTLQPSDSGGYEVVFENNLSANIADTITFVLDYQDFSVKVTVEATWNYLCETKDCPDILHIVEVPAGYLPDVDSVSVKENGKDTIYINFPMG